MLFVPEYMDIYMYRYIDARIVYHTLRQDSRCTFTSGFSLNTCVERCGKKGVWFGFNGQIN